MAGRRVRDASEHDGYIVVEKVGEAGEMATELAGESTAEVEA